jgi:hypothetical protein
MMGATNTKREKKAKKGSTAKDPETTDLAHQRQQEKESLKFLLI